MTHLTRITRMTRTLGTLALALPAHACTVCNSPTGHQVRAGLFNGHFLHTSLLVAAPFPIFAALLVLLHFGMPDLNMPARALEHETLAL